MRHGFEEERARYCQTLRRVDSLTLQLETSKKNLESLAAERDDLQAQVIDLLALDAANVDDKNALKSQLKEMNSVMERSQMHVKDLEAQLAQLKSDKEAWLSAEKDLKDSLSKSEESRVSTEGRLVITLERVKHLEVCLLW
jgi:chromosome segregation ATPase